MQQLVQLKQGFLICGYTAKDQLLIDLDNCSVVKAVALARMLQKEYPFVGDCLVVQCSDDSYHLVFGNKLSWRKISKIVSTLAQLGILNEDYMKIRKFRKDLTLRISPKTEPLKQRDTPKPLLFLFNHYWHGKRDCLTLRYLKALEAFL
jgi:hypothetical protein